MKLLGVFYLKYEIKQLVHIVGVVIRLYGQLFGHGTDFTTGRCPFQRTKQNGSKALSFYLLVTVTAFNSNQLFHLNVCATFNIYIYISKHSPVS